MRNIGWLLSDQLIRIPVSLLLSVLMVRYLGPRQTGLWNFAIAFSLFFGILTGLAQDTIIVRDLVSLPDRRDTLMGSAFALKLAGGLLAIPASILALSLAGPRESISLILVALSSIGLAIGSFSTIDCFFQAGLSSKLSVFSKNISFAFFSAVKLLLLFLKAPLLLFALANLGDIAFGFLFVAIVYRKKGHSIRNWNFDTTTALQIVKDSLPLLVSAFAIVVYTRIDIVMLGSAMDESTVGIYSAAVKLCEAWLFIPSAIAGSALPGIVMLKNGNPEGYGQMLEKVIRRSTQAGIFIAIAMTVFSKPLVSLLYGAEFKASADILAINIWGGLFIFVGISSVPFFTAEKLQRYTLYRTIAGMAVNVALNLLLIPLYGAKGAAIATVVTQCVASYLFNAVNKKTRPLFIMQTRAFLPFAKLKKPRGTSNLPWQASKAKTEVEMKNLQD